MPQRIDAFAHVLPRDFYDEMMDVYPTDELRALGEVDVFWDVESRLSDMDEFGIDKQVLALARPPIWMGMDADAALELTRAANDAVREYADQRPERFIPVGTLPRFDEGFVDEAVRCIEDLGMAGIQVFSNVEGNPIDSGSAESIFAVAERNDAPVWLHPQLHDWYDWDTEFLIHKTLGWPFDTSVAMCRLVYSGIMERHPDLSIITHHMGAMIPHFESRLDLFMEMLIENQDVYPYEPPDSDQPLTDQFRRFYGDTCRNGDAHILEDGLEFYGDDQLVFATDYPFGPQNGRGFMSAEVGAVDEMDVSDEQRERVLSGNIRSLLS